MAANRFFLLIPVVICVVLLTGIASASTISTPGNRFFFLEGMEVEEGLNLQASSQGLEGRFHLIIKNIGADQNKFSFLLNPGLKVAKVFLNDDLLETSEGIDKKLGPFRSVTLSRNLKSGDEIIVTWQGQILGKRFSDGKYINDDSMYFFEYSNFFPRFFLTPTNNVVKRFAVQLVIPSEFSQLIGNLVNLETRPADSNFQTFDFEFADPFNSSFFILKKFSCRTFSQNALTLKLYKRTEWDESIATGIPFQAAFISNLFQRLLNTSLNRGEITIVMEDPKRFTGGSSHKNFILVQEPVNEIHLTAHEIGHFFWNTENLQTVEKNTLYFSENLYLTEGMSNFFAVFGFTMVNAWMEFFIEGSPVSFENCFEDWYTQKSALSKGFQKLSEKYSDAVKKNKVELLKNDLSFNVNFSTMFFWALMAKTSPEKFFPAVSRFYSEISANKTAPDFQHLFDLLNFPEGQIIKSDLKAGMKFINENWHAQDSRIFSWYSLKKFVDFIDPANPGSRK